MRPFREESGFTLVELLTAMMIGLIVLAVLGTLVGVTARSSTRTTERVVATQRARPVMDRIIDELHSSCLRPDAPPIQSGSSGNAISFLHKTGSAVTPVPDRRTITLASGTMTERVYPATGGTAPAWTFASTPSYTRRLLTDVGVATTGANNTTVPMFRYYTVVNGTISTTPLPVPLSAADAARTVKVTVTFTGSPEGGNLQDPEGPVAVTDSAVLSFTPNGGAATVGAPCV
jgi:type II secretory pathway pseudopilin PulG